VCEEMEREKVQDKGVKALDLRGGDGTGAGGSGSCSL